MATNKDYEIDAQGNIIKDNKKRSSIMIEQRIRHMVYDIISEEILEDNENMIPTNDLNIEIY